jgi:hypothetical protein
MSSFRGGDGGLGGPGGLPQGVTQAQLDEIKSFNAGLTKAGNKSRPTRSRGSGVNFGPGSGISPRRGGSYSLSNTSHPDSAAGFGGVTSYSIGSSTPSPITKPAARETVPIHLRGRIDVSKTRWATLDGTEAGFLGEYTMRPLSSAMIPPKPRSRSPTRSSILTTQRPQPSPPKPQQQQAQTFQRLQNVEQGQDPITRIPAPPSRVRSVDNWTLDKPSKPFNPAHLQQDPCLKTIEDVSEMTDRGMFTL